MYKSNINLNLYKTFYEVAKYGSISETAKNTYSSQPAISKSIKKLESDLNVKLFYRTINGVELTEKGKELLFYVEKSYNNLAIAERKLIETSNLERGKLSIGMPSNIGTFFVFDHIIDFHKRYPNIEITIITGTTTTLLNDLESHKVDFIIDTSPINTSNSDIIIKKLEKVNYRFIGKSNGVVDIDSIKSLKDLEDIPLILPVPNTTNRNELDTLLLENNININNVINIYTSEMIISAIKNDLGIGYIIENVVEKELNSGEFKIVNIKEMLPTSTINLVYNENYLTESSIKFINDYIIKL